VSLDLVGENLERAGDEPGCAVWVLARAAAAHRLDPARARRVPPDDGTTLALPPASTDTSQSGFAWPRGIGGNADLACLGL
jgi:hypothetical protein